MYISLPTFLLSETVSVVPPETSLVVAVTLLRPKGLVPVITGVFVTPATLMIPTKYRSLDAVLTMTIILLVVLNTTSLVQMVL